MIRVTSLREGMVFISDGEELVAGEVTVLPNNRVTIALEGRKPLSLPASAKVELVEGAEGV